MASLGAASGADIGGGATMMVAPATSAPPDRPPRLLLEVADVAWPSLDRHRTRHRLPPQPERRPRDDIVNAITDAGLRGRGGASFPTGKKIVTVARAGPPARVVVNGSEGEPASRKDSLLLRRAPHLVLDGAIVAAAATGARAIDICVDRHNVEALAALTDAIDERWRFDEPMPEISIFDVPARFVTGEESALVHYLNGGEAKPTATPPRVFIRGVDDEPTLVVNVETVAHIAQITQWGAEWFRRAGTAAEPGTVLSTVSGEVARPGVCEVELGTPLTQVVAASGGTPATPAGVLVGGYYGTWLSADDAARATMSARSLTPLGAAIGCGALVVLPASSCGLSETARVVRWLASESAGQCGPCVHGLAALAAELTDLATGRSTRDSAARLARWTAMIDGRGGCRFPDGVVRLVRSALRVFADDVEHHLLHGPCRRTASRPVLPVPASDGLWR
jgi:NADH:ubiquinone oxidoreductase subunit F (NADH-binding)